MLLPHDRSGQPAAAAVLLNQLSLVACSSESSFRKCTFSELPASELGGSWDQLSIFFTTHHPEPAVEYLGLVDQDLGRSSRSW